jgi:hypothetical protein
MKPAKPTMRRNGTPAMTRPTRSSNDILSDVNRVLPNRTLQDTRQARYPAGDLLIVTRCKNFLVTC